MKPPAQCCGNCRWWNATLCLYPLPDSIQFHERYLMSATHGRTCKTWQGNFLRQRSRVETKQLKAENAALKLKLKEGK